MHDHKVSKNTIEVMSLRELQIRLYSTPALFKGDWGGGGGIMFLDSLLSDHFILVILKWIISLTY